MLRAVHSNRVEHLLGELLAALPPADPFAPSTIVVGSHLVARWLSREIALARGIAAGLDMVTFDAFVEATWANDAVARAARASRRRSGGDGASLRGIDRRGPDGSAGGAAVLARGINRRQLAAALASVLVDEGVVRGLPPVAAYLAAAPAPGDRAGPRRVQLAEHLAELVWTYALTRPDWMPALMIGQVPGELAGDPSARWQAALLGAALARLGAVPTPMLPWLRRRAGLPTPAREPVAVFGMSFLARAQLEALTDLATTSDVTVYVLDPCEELWDDTAGRRAAGIAAAAAAGPIGDPLPLVLWGRAVRDTLSALVERTGGDLEARFAGGDGDGGGDGPADGAATGATARERLLDDVRRRRTPSLDGGEPVITSAAGVAVLACPNPRREIEVIAAEVRRRLDADPGLLAHQIGVWIAGDAERYLAQAPSAFEAVGVPCHLIDAPLDDRGRIGEAVLAMLALPTGAMARRDLLRVMTHPAVLAGYPHVDADDWVRWTERLGIVHGSDSSAHAGTYLEDYPGQFHWDQGVRRLALGAYMVGERAQRGAARIASLEVAPEEVRPEQQASAATYALLVRSLCADAEWLATLEAPLAMWARVFASMVDDYLAPRDDDAARDLERVRAILAGIADVDLDGREVGFREAREHAVRRLAAARANRGEPLAAGVMIAPLAAMRAVPFRITFVAGLDEGAFPASDRISPLDLRREPRAGDVGPRDRDRAAFLDVLLASRDALYLSYVASEENTGQPLAPSSIVLELGDALAPYLGAASSRDALARITVRHPLHRHGAAAGTAAGAMAGTAAGTTVAATAEAEAGVGAAVARERWACAVRDGLRGHLRRHGRPIPDEDGLLALLAHPAQAALRAELGMVEPPAELPASAASRPLTIANLRGFLEYPVQAWAQAVLGLDELPDDEALEHSDEPFHLSRAERAVLLREVFAAQLRDPAAASDPAAPLPRPASKAAAAASAVERASSSAPAGQLPRPAGKAAGVASAGDPAGQRAWPSNVIQFPTLHARMSSSARTSSSDPNAVDRAASTSSSDPTGDASRSAGKAASVDPWSIDPTVEPPGPAGHVIGGPTRSSSSIDPSIDHAGESPRPASTAIGTVPPIDQPSQVDSTGLIPRPAVGTSPPGRPAHVDPAGLVARNAGTASVPTPPRAMSSIDGHYDAAVKDRQLRGQFPVGVFAEAARKLDLEVLRTWRAGLGPVPIDGATRIAFGRASSPGAELLPALSIELSGCRTIKLIGQTELLIRGPRYTSVVTLLRKLEKRSPYHLRGAFDHLMLAAAGLAEAGHVHRVIDDRGAVCEVEHAAWTPSEARGYLATLIGELLDAPHGYLLPFEALVKALAGGRSPSYFGDPTGGLGYGPIDRSDGLQPPADAAALARRRLLPLIERMRGDHGFEVGR